MNRRGFLQSMLATGVAPYVSTMAGVLMPCRASAIELLPLPEQSANYGVFFGSENPTIVASKGSMYYMLNSGIYINVDGAKKWQLISSVDK